MGLGRKAGRHGEGLDDRQGVRLHLGEVDLRRRMGGPADVDDVGRFADQRPNVRGRPRLIEEREQGREAAVGAAHEAQPQAPETNVGAAILPPILSLFLPLVLARELPRACGRRGGKSSVLSEGVRRFAAWPTVARHGAFDEQPGMIDERPKNAEDLRRGERATPRLRLSREAIVIRLVCLSLGFAQVLPLGELIPGHARATGEMTAGAALLHERFDVEDGVLSHDQAKSEAFFGTRGAGLSAHAFDTRVERREREVPRRAFELGAETRMGVGLAGIAEEPQHRLEGGDAFFGEHFAWNGAIAAQAQPAETSGGGCFVSAGVVMMRVLPSETRQADFDELAVVTRGVRVDEGAFGVAEHGLGAGRQANLEWFVRPGRTAFLLIRRDVERQPATVALLLFAQASREVLDERGEHGILRLAAFGGEEGGAVSREPRQRRHPPEVAQRRRSPAVQRLGREGGFLGRDVLPSLIARGAGWSWHQEVAVREALAVASHQRPARGSIGRHQEIVESLGDAVGGRPRQDRVRPLRRRRNQRRSGRRR